MIGNLPLEIFYHVISFMGGPELCRLRLCSRPIAELVTPMVFRTISIKGPTTDKDTTGFDLVNIPKKLKYILPFAHYARTLEFGPAVYSAGFNRHCM